MTDAARRRKEQFQRWFVRIFDIWYTDVTEASGAKARECLTDNFPYDSPGKLDKENVFKFQLKFFQSLEFLKIENTKKDDSRF